MVRNNSQITKNPIGTIYNYNHSGNSTKRTSSNVGRNNKQRPNINVKRSNTSIGGTNLNNRITRNNIGHTSDSSTSSTGYISDHRNKNNRYGVKDFKGTYMGCSVVRSSYRS